ncbi:MAG TPA: histidine kinase [Acidimicrobiales bacterium]|nr:histidine kinase [Acidimicrobiales bacterium]
MSTVPGTRLAWVRTVLTGSGDEESAHEAWGNERRTWRRLAHVNAEHPVFGDATVAFLVAAVSAAWSVNHQLPGAAKWLLQAALVVPLVWRRRYPVGTFGLISLVALLQWALGYELVADLALLVALYTVASHRPRLVAAAAAGVIEVGAAMASFRWSLAGSWLRSFIFLSGLAAAALLLGTNLRSRRARLAALTERAERLERERDQRELMAAAEERARIAREMHDVIAHSLAVIISLADGAAAKLASDPGRARAAIVNVSAIGRQALGDTRRLLGVLRADHSPDGLAPQPGVAQVAALVDEVRGTGLEVGMEVVGDVRPLPPGVELTAFRIVQEATTNVLKHAMGATRLAVVLRYGADLLDVCVRDNGEVANALTLDRQARPASRSSAGGHGLAGMRERALVYNGAVTAGPCGDGWQVLARIPIDPPFAPGQIEHGKPLGRTGMDL